MTNCPKCGADSEKETPNLTDYVCGSTSFNRGKFLERPQCLRNQLDALAAERDEWKRKAERRLKCLKSIEFGLDDCWITLPGGSKAAIELAAILNDKE